MKVSIIIPIYNVEQYLEDCLQSVLAQSYHDLEIILVDDVSPDICPQMCDEYAKTDERIIVVHRMKNGGLSAARNSGLAIATGDYVYFLDSDDRIYPDTIELMVMMIEKYSGVDLVQGNIEIQGRHSHYSDVICQQPEYIVYDGGSTTPLYKSCPVTVWNKMIRRSLLIDNNITFVEGLLHEDEMFRWNIHRLVKSIAIVKDFTYWYRTDNQSSIMAATKKARLMSHAVTILEHACKDDIKTKEEIFWAIGLLAHNRLQVSKQDIAEFNIEERLHSLDCQYSLPLPLKMEVLMWAKHMGLYHNNVFYQFYLTLRKAILKFYR